MSKQRRIQQLTTEEWQLVQEFVTRWRALHTKRKPRTKKCVTAVMRALGGVIYVWAERDAELAVIRDNEDALKYAVDVLAEHDGVWIVGHRRPSGRWRRQQRARKAGAR